MAQKSLLFIVAAVGMVLMTTTATAEQPETTSSGATKLLQRTYPVADLLTGLDTGLSRLEGEFPWIAAQAGTPDELRLIHLITNIIAPQSWACVGGPGTIDYFPLGMALVIKAMPEIHEIVAELLKELRANQDLEVAVEVRFLSVSPEMAERLGRLGIDCCFAEDDATRQPHLAYLSERELRLLMEWVQQDPRAKLTQAPKVTMFNGQAASVRCQDFEWFVTDVKILSDGHSIVYVPQNEPVALGFDLRLQPVVSADRRSVRMATKVQMTDLVSATVPLSPITRFIEGADSQPGESAWFVQAMPEVNKLQFDQELSLEDGQTAVLSGWKFKHKEPAGTWKAWLRQVPCLNALFGPAETSEHVLVLVTPRIIKNEEEMLSTGVQAVPEADPATKEAVAKLLNRYRQARKEGRYAEAQRLADAARMLDPSCYKALP